MVALFSIYLYLAIILFECHRGSTLALCCTVPSLFYFPSLSWVIKEFCLYQDLTKSLINTFFIFPMLWKKLLRRKVFLIEKKDDCLISHENCLFGRSFSQGTMCRVSSLCRDCFWSLGRVPDAPPNSKVIIVPFLWLVSEKGSQKFIYI